MARKGQSGSNAAVVVIITMVLIVLYILFLPPAEREDLLAGGTGTGGHGGVSDSTGSSSISTSVLLKETVGKVYSQNDDEKKYDLPTFTVSSKTQSDIIKTKSFVYVKSSAFQEVTDKIEFNINPKLTENLILSFNAKSGEGRLSVQLNGNTVYTGDLMAGNSPPIYLDKDQLESNNVLLFSVSGPGIAFWRYNEYDLTDVKITGDVTDISGSENRQTLSVQSKDLQNIKSSRLRFLADCKEESVENFEVLLNGQLLFKGIPDCAVYNYITIDPTTLKDGNNDFEFGIARGKVLVDRVELQNKFDDPDYPIFYFDIDEKYFNQNNKKDVCGEADGICPRGCEEDEDVDCCFARSDNFWCDVETDNLNDRCVSFVNDCDRCSSGYEDRSNDPPDKCVIDGVYCGDDTDGICPTGTACSIYDDKDCCFETYDGGYWCDDVPNSGLTSVCERSIELEECNDCPYDYENKDGDRPDCRSYTNTNDDDEETLLSSLDVELKFVFTNDNQKKMDVFINGRTIGINTAKEEYTRDISDYVRSGSNSIEIRPDDDITITELRVTIN